MFHFFNKKSCFEKYYSKFVSQSIIKEANNHKPITAAYLYVISDLFFTLNSGYVKREENAQRVFSFLEDHCLTKKELDVFDKLCDLYGQIARGETRARGDWCLNDKRPGAADALYLCYGDLIYNPHCMENYSNSPILIKGADSQMQFTLEFSKIRDLTVEYIGSLQNEY